MPRPRKIDRPKRIEVQLPESIHTKVTLELYSELEGRVPFGAFSTLVQSLLADWLRKRGINA